MDDQEEQYLSFIKQDIKTIQYIDDEKQLIMSINLVLKDLCHIADETIITEIKKFNEKNKGIQEKLWEITRQVDELNSQSLENYKHMYQEVLLKL